MILFLSRIDVRTAGVSGLCDAGKRISLSTLNSPLTQAVLKLSSREIRRTFLEKCLNAFFEIVSFARFDLKCVF